MIKDDMQKKVLVVATVGRFLNFERNDIKILKSMGYEVHCATNLELEEVDDIRHIDVIKHQIDFTRSPFSPSIIKAYKQLNAFLKDEHFDVIHCHTPVGGLLARIAGRKYRKKGTTIIYTAHGFHFYEGAPIKNWMMFYPVELICSYWTDILITINTEDYQRAKRNFHAKNVLYVPGIGVDTEKFKSGLIDIRDKRTKLGLIEDEIMLLSVGELSHRKNHEIVIKALAQLKEIKGFDKIHYFICGQGDLLSDLQATVHNLKLDTTVTFLGYGNDISELCQAADLYIFPSLQEGVPAALMEAIACKTPVICSEIHGSDDLIDEKNDKFEGTNLQAVVMILKEKLIDEKNEISRTALAQKMQNSVKRNYVNLSKFDLTEVAKQMNEIYLGGGLNEIKIIQQCVILHRTIVRQKFLKELGLENDSCLLLSVGELNENKNHSAIIKALPILKKNIHYIIAGTGDLQDELINLSIELGVKERVHLLGFRSDIADILQCVDIYLLPSIREGLNVSLMEAMATGLPCICSVIRGNNDLIDDNFGGYRVNCKDVSAWSEAIQKILKKDMILMGNYNRKKIKKYSRDVVSKTMENIYEKVNR